LAWLGLCDLEKWMKKREIVKEKREGKYVCVCVCEREREKR